MNGSLRVFLVLSFRAASHYSTGLVALQFNNGRLRRKKIQVSNGTDVSTDDRSSRDSSRTAQGKGEGDRAKTRTGTGWRATHGMGWRATHGTGNNGTGNVPHNVQTQRSVIAKQLSKLGGPRSTTESQGKAVIESVISRPLNRIFS